LVKHVDYLYYCLNRIEWDSERGYFWNGIDSENSRRLISYVQAYDCDWQRLRSNLDIFLQTKLGKTVAKTLYDEEVNTLKGCF